MMRVKLFGQLLAYWTKYVEQSESTEFEKSRGGSTRAVMPRCNVIGFRPTMDMWDLKKWRRALGYSQVDAAEMLGVSRGAVQHWESERTPVPTVVELACDELTRQWRQRPDFGPVVLIYSDEPMWPEPACPSRGLCLQREWFA